MSLRSAFAITLFGLLSLSAEAQQGQTLTGTIKEFTCGDNCYLTIRTEQGREETALCEAKDCQPWNDMTAMPAKFIGRRIRVGVGNGIQYDGSGRRMGTMKSFRTITWL